MTLSMRLPAVISILTAAFLSICFLQKRDMVQAHVIDTEVTRLTSTWDFSKADCGCPPCRESCRREDEAYYDCDLIFIFDPPLGNALITFAGGLPLGDVPIDSVDSVPVDGYAQSISANLNEQFQAGRTYAIRTREGHYALIRPTYVNEFEGGFAFRVRYQDDGSTSFEEKSPIQKSLTWGELKCRILSP